MEYGLILFLIILAWGIWAAVRRKSKQARMYALKKETDEMKTAVPSEIQHVEPIRRDEALEVDDAVADDDMLLVDAGAGEMISLRLCSRRSRMLQWESKEKNDDGMPVHIRLPQESTASFRFPESFEAAGRSYASTEQLTAEKCADGTRRDCYGRRVVSLAELFPCFDSYDRQYEDRYYRWWLILEPGRLTRIYHEDDSDRIFVTEDVRMLENNCVQCLKELGYISDTESQ